MQTRRACMDGSTAWHLSCADPCCLPAQGGHTRQHTLPSAGPAAVRGQLANSPGAALWLPCPAWPRLLSPSRFWLAAAGPTRHNRPPPLLLPNHSLRSRCGIIINFCQTSADCCRQHTCTKTPGSPDPGICMPDAPPVCPARGARCSTKPNDVLPLCCLLDYCDTSQHPPRCADGTGSFRCGGLAEPCDAATPCCYAWQCKAKRCEVRGKGGGRRTARQQGVRHAGTDAVQRRPLDGHAADRWASGDMSRIATPPPPGPHPQAP